MHLPSKDDLMNFSVLQMCVRVCAGACDCQHNTGGLSCERCRDGFYGDATRGTSSDCQPCPCPAGATCASVPKSGQVVCTNCPAGTTGTTRHQRTHISRCMYAYIVPGFQVPNQKLAKLGRVSPTRFLEASPPFLCRQAVRAMRRRFLRGPAG